MPLFDQLAGAVGSGAAAYGGAQAQSDAITNSIPQPTTLSMSPSDAQAQFGQQGALLPQIGDMLNKVTDLDNTNFQNAVRGLDPRLAGNIGGVDNLAAQFGRGYVDPETAAAIKRQTAYQALQGGYGGGSGMEDANYRVQLGKQALTEQELSPQLQGEAMNQSLALNPTHTDVGSTLISPAAILARQDAQDYYNQQLRNQFANVNASFKAANDAGKGGSGMGNIMGMLGGSGGGGGMMGGGGGGLMSMIGSFGGGG
jgi:hypothetical protein